MKKFLRSLLPYIALAIVVLVFAVITTQVVTAKVNTTTVPTWKIQTSPAKPFDKVAFVNAFSGLAVGAGGTIVTTTNGGLTWATQPHPGGSPATNNLWGVAFPDHCYGYAVGPNLILKFSYP